MTLSEIKASKEIFLTPNDIATVLGSDAQTIRDMAKTDQAKLGFPVTVVGSRVKIPRKPFLKWIGEN